jgi:[calcium/calmodulin-dependent protein kinase] kinase
MTKEVADRMLAFQSDPSLPALLSSTSSVSADPEGEFLGNPGLVGRSSIIDTTDSLTPPAFAKESMSGFPLEGQGVHEGVVPVRLDRAGGRPPLGIRLPVSRCGSRGKQDDDDDNDSDSDEGLTMARRKKKPAAATAAEAPVSAVGPRDAQAAQAHSVERLVGNARRRDTNASVGSTETAKKVFVDSE